MNTTKNLPRLVDDLAAHGTELVLGILSRAGLRISVDTEIETWRVLKEVLRAALKEPNRTDFMPRLRVAANAQTGPAYAAI
jgi:hypothetical protein